MNPRSETPSGRRPGRFGLCGLAKAFVPAVLVAWLTGCASAPETAVRPAAHVDLPRYMGDWHVIANIPYFAEKDCYNSLETYRLDAQGRIPTVFTARKGGFDGRKLIATNVATVEDPGRNARWKAAFFGGLVKVRLVIVHVDADYRVAALTTPDARLAWILGRAPKISESEFSTASRALAASGVDVTRLVRVPQNGERP